jgi:RNA polymerase sigma factor (TIGR02999 family)
MGWDEVERCWHAMTTFGHNTSSGDGPDPGGAELRASAEELVPVLYQELRRMAAGRVRNERGGGAGMGGSATSLVHSAYLRLVGGKPQHQQWQNRAHFFGAAALAMRRILVDRARRRATHQRAMDSLGDEMRIEDDLAGDLLGSRVDMLALDDAMKALEQLDPSVHSIVMLRYFAGLSVEDTAEMAGMSAATVKRQWAFARLWLLDRISGNNA